MSRAILTCGRDEFDDAKERLVQRGKLEPSTKEVLKEANSVIPPPFLLRSNVEAVLKYCLAKDAEADRMIVTRRDDDTSPMPCKFFRNSSLVKEVVQKQMKHVDKGCLSDPPSNLVNIFRFNPRKKCCYVARGTNTNERDNLDLGHNILVTATHIGIHRADRLMCTFFERKNQDKSVSRLGQDDIGTYDTEKLLILNSYAQSLGYDKDMLPFPKATAPTLNPNAPKEYMGFAYHLPEKLHRVCNPTDATEVGAVYSDDEESLSDMDEEPEQLTEAQVDDFVHILGDEYDVEIVVGPEEEEAIVDATAELRQEQLQSEEDSNKADTVVNKEFIQRELARLVPVGEGRETTLESFHRLTSDHSWIPFRMSSAKRTSSVPHTKKGQSREIPYSTSVVRDSL